jgi:acetyltransferase-like isoleucine patch superfamily enzyme
VKIGAFCNICPGVTIENGVMISNGTIFTNHKFPRATTPDLQRLRRSEADNETLLTLVREGATLGAGVTVLGGVVIGRFAMIGLGAVVTSSVPDFHLAIGHPAKSAGCVCRCGSSLMASAGGRIPDVEEVPCAACGFKYTIVDEKVVELTPPV